MAWRLSHGNYLHIEMEKNISESWWAWSCPLWFPFFLPSWRAVRSYWSHLEERDPIWGDDWSHSLFIRRSPSWVFSGVFLGCKANARRSVPSPQDHFIITLAISDQRNWRHTRGKWPLARNPDRSWWHRHTNWKFFWPQPMAPWTFQGAIPPPSFP